jgi:hypothetical protein
MTETTALPPGAKPARARQGHGAKYYHVSPRAPLHTCTGLAHLMDRGGEPDRAPWALRADALRLLSEPW